MRQPMLQPGSAEAVVLRAVYEDAQRECGKIVSWVEVRRRLEEQRTLSIPEIDAARRRLEQWGYLLGGPDAAQYANLPGGAVMDTVVTEEGKRRLDDVEAGESS